MIYCLSTWRHRWQPSKRHIEISRHNKNALKAKIRYRIKCWLFLPRHFHIQNKCEMKLEVRHKKNQVEEKRVGGKQRYNESRMEYFEVSNELFSVRNFQ